MAQNVFDSLSENFLHCSICTERYHEPKMLPCLHSFCLHCLEEWVNNQHHDQPLSCPNCRYTVDLPHSGVNGFPSNFFLVSLIERFDEARTLSTQHRNFNCNICRQENSILFCLECKIHSCRNCKGIHDRLAGTAEHPFIPFDRLSDENYVQKVISSRSLRCHSHKEEKLCYYCTQCSKLACQVCTVVSHQGHQSLQELESKVNSVKAQWKAFLENSKTEAKHLRDKSTKTKTNAESIRKQISSLLKNVDARYTEIVAKLQSDREKLRQELEDIENEKCTSLKDADNKILKLLRPIEHTQELTRRILEQNNARELLEMETHIAQTFQRLQTDTLGVDKLSLPESVDLSFFTSKLIVLDHEKEEILRNAELIKSEQSSHKTRGAAKAENEPLEYLKDQNWLGKFFSYNRFYSIMTETLQKWKQIMTMWKPK
ncbi:E3 ubiquitin-protein ligase TRIM56 [Holothuria leucospilota]|uniref:E3 ubiquitin-protein ligase TRIM56 n=1 Tax=Holothuria leucospilota TaxID=206669 RepID=A0A9Q1BD44_HOLLE|nr:E3 ubiquitin-protein ligase TRIM56 [Holothuria leucospilota]